MLTLLRVVSLRYYRANLLRTAITVLGVTLGVAVLAAIRITNVSTLRAFERSVEAIAGRARLQVMSDGGSFDERLLPIARRQPGVAAAAPVVEARMLVAGTPGEMLLVVGVDLLADRAVRDYDFKRGPRERRGAASANGADAAPQPAPLDLLVQPNAILLSERFAERYGLRVGSRLDLFTPTGKKQFEIKALLGFQGPARALSGNFAVLDIAAAQVHLEKLGRLDRIDVALQPGFPLDDVQARLQHALGERVRVERPESRTASVEQMLRSFHVNLFALSLIALFVGMFLIYNTVSFAVVQRRKEIGILRSLGVTRRRIGWLFLVETLALGFAGSILGLLLGLLLSKGALQLVSNTVTTLFILVSVRDLTVTPGTVLLGLVLGTLSAPLSALPPIVSATCVAPTAALQRTGAELAFQQRGLRRGVARLTLAGILGLLLAWVLAGLKAVNDVPLFGYAACFVTVLGAALLMPLGTLLATRLARPPLERLFGIEGRLAGDNLRSSLGRTSIAIAALMAGFAMVVSVGTMIHSFKQTVTAWVEQTVRADLVINQASPVSSSANVKMPARIATEIAAVEGVAEVDRFKAVNVRYRGRPVFMAVGELDIFGRYSRFFFLEGRKTEALRQVIENGAVLISENFSVRTGLHRGDTLRLATPSGPAEFPIAGVLLDYTSDRGTITIDRRTFLKYWQDDLVDTLGVFLRPGFDPQAVAQAITRRFGERYSLFVMTNKAFKAEIVKILDQSFQITYALEIIAMIVALLGILNALFASIIERTREIGILRSVGAVARQIRRIVMVEAALMGLVAELTGFLTGVALAYLLINVINKQSFGWTIQTAYPAAFLIVSTLVIFLTACLAGYLPARRAAATDLKEALHYE